MGKTRIAFHTLGCKLNFSETSTIARDFREDDFEVVDFREEADIYVINTCSVTGTAEKKCRLAIRQAHHRNSGARIAVVGCFSQLKPRQIAQLEGVDIILGSNDKFALHDILTGKEKKEAEESPPSFLPSYSSGDRTRSFVKIQDGCDYYCAYCTIPFARGHSRSGTIAGVLDTVSGALRQGIKEIVLTGVNVGDFGKNTGETFLGLLNALNHVNRLERIRISSVEPDLLNDGIIRLVARSEKLMPHFHIPLQSGSPKILRAMKRKYGVEVFATRVNLIRELLPHACIAADVIVGFPGETGEDFAETYRLIERLPVSYVHVFSYSERPGTLASRLEGKVRPSEIRDRSRRLQALSDQKRNAFYEACRAYPARVLFESTQKGGMMQGFSDNYIPVKTPYDPSLVNQVVPVLLDRRDSDGTYLYLP